MRAGVHNWEFEVLLSPSECRLGTRLAHGMFTTGLAYFVMG